MIKKMVLILFLITSFTFAADNYWVKPMKELHQKFAGKKGFVALYGDSITYAKEFWLPIKEGVKNCKDIDVKILVSYISEDSWALKKGVKNGNYPGWTIKNGLSVIDACLKKHNPEVAIVMFGANDVQFGSPSETGYDKDMRTFVQKCLDNYSIVLISTVPPWKEHLDGIKHYNDEIVKIAKEKGLPVIEYYEEIMKRRPKDWNGILVSGVHPTWVKETGNDFSEENLKNSGYALRSYVTLKKYDEVYEKVLKTK